jgi:LysR family transcriptional regulator, transcriptional activator for bauABCD operon
MAQSTLLPRRLGDAHLRLLRIFKVVVDYGGYVAAETELNISKSAISLAISELESLLAMRLCSRGRSGFALTEHGEQVYQGVVKLFSSIEEFRTNMNAINTELRGDLNIGLTDNMVTIPHMKITKALAKLSQQASGVRINISMLAPEVIEAGVLEENLHVGVIPKLRSLTGLNYIPLYQEMSILYCAKEHPLFDKKNTLSDEQLYQYATVTHAYPKSEAINQAQKGLKSTATSNAREGILFLILTAQYIGFLPKHFAEPWVVQGLLKPLHSERRCYTTEFCVITRKGRRDNIILNKFCDILDLYL